MNKKKNDWFTNNFYLIESRIFLNKRLDENEFIRNVILVQKITVLYKLIWMFNFF